MFSFGVILIIIGFIFLFIGKSMQMGERVTSWKQSHRRPMYPPPPKPSRQRPSSRLSASSSTPTGGVPGWKEPTSGEPSEFVKAKVGDKITYIHPEHGLTSATITGTIKYIELWQTSKGPNAPWKPTGNLFTAHWTGDTLLYAWKGGVWLLDKFDPLTDADIKRQFLPHAKRFGQSDETADVYFAYPPGSWKISDIGKYRVKSVEGEGLRLQSDAVGRFIHASGGSELEGWALVVEDYQEGGGGLDTAWMGWQVTWDDIDIE